MHINDKDFKTIEEMSYSIEDIINNGTIDFKDGDKVVIKKDGYVVTIRKNVRQNGKKNSPQDMDTITMWADVSDRVNNASRRNPAVHVQNVISTMDAAKIRKDAELAIEKDEKTDFPYPITKTIQPRERSWIENYLVDKD